jgi:hypothetical protein
VDRQDSWSKNLAVEISRDVINYAGEQCCGCSLTALL